MSDWPPVVDAEKSNIKSLDNLNLARKRPWKGCAGSAGELFTDGTVLLHTRHLAEKSLAKKLKEKSQDRTIEPEQIEERYDGLPEAGYVANVRGYISRHPHAYHHAEHLALIAWRNWQEHWSTDAKLLKLVQHLVGDCETRTGEDAVMVFEKPSGNVAAAMKLYELPIELKDAS